MKKSFFSALVLMLVFVLSCSQESGMKSSQEKKAAAPPSWMKAAVSKLESDYDCEIWRSAALPDSAGLEAGSLNSGAMRTAIKRPMKNSFKRILRAIRPRWIRCLAALNTFWNNPWVIWPRSAANSSSKRILMPDRCSRMTKFLPAMILPRI